MSETRKASRSSWFMKVEKDLKAMADELVRDVREWSGPETVFTPEEFGYIPGEKATCAIQRAVDAAAVNGGIVRLSCGKYISGTIEMRSGVCLEICAGSELLGSTCLADYPEHRAKRLTVQDTSMGMHQSLIYAEGCENMIPEKPIEDIAFRNVVIRQKASAGPVLKDSDFSEMRGVYPDAHMIDTIGDAPAFGLWARHVKGLDLDSYEICPAGNDPRPFIEFSDVGFSFSGTPGYVPSPF